MVRNAGERIPFTGIGEKVDVDPVLAQFASGVWILFAEAGWHRELSRRQPVVEACCQGHGTAPGLQSDAISGIAPLVDVPGRSSRGIR